MSRLTKPAYPVPLMAHRANSTHLVQYAESLKKAFSAWVDGFSWLQIRLGDPVKQDGTQACARRTYRGRGACRAPTDYNHISVFMHDRLIKCWRASRALGGQTNSTA